jgi:hypothetical protein
VAEASGTRLGATQRYAPLVPTFSPYTADARAAVRLAWRVTLLSAAALAIIVVGGPALRSWYVGSATEARTAGLTAIDGIVFLRREGAREWQPAGPDTHVGPGDTLRTAANARAFVQLFDQSTVLLYPSSTLRVLRSEQGRFRSERGTLMLELSGGRARFGVAPPAEPGAMFFQIRSPHAEVHLEEGSYTANVTASTTQVRVRRGEATAHPIAADGAAPVAAMRQPAPVAARSGQLLAVSADRPAVGGQPLRADLLENGYLADRLGADVRGWVPVDASEEEPAGTISFTELPGAVTLRRVGKGHGETLLSQQLDENLWDYERLTLAVDFRVLSHSLSGGGFQGTEYPLTLRVYYRDATGGRVPWYRGFYLQNPENLPVTNGVRVPSTDWQHVDVDLLALSPRPWRIETVQIVAQGWDFAAAVRDVHLWAE